MNPFRSQALKDFAKECPHCMHCGKENPNGGLLMGVHLDSLEGGKGMGIKANDVVAYMCDRCHRLIDGRSKDPDMKGRWEKLSAFYRAAYRSLVWLIQTHRLVVGEAPYED